MIVEELNENNYQLMSVKSGAGYQMNRNKILKLKMKNTYNFLIIIALIELFFLALMIACGKQFLADKDISILAVITSIVSSLVAIVSLMMARDSMSKKQDFLKNYPKLILKNIIIKENSNPKADWKEYENVGAMDISDYKELYYIDLTEIQYRNYVKGKYVPSGQSVSYNNNITDDECIFRYIQIAATVDHKYVVLSDGYYRLERQAYNKYIVIQKSLTYYFIDKDKYDKSSTVITSETNMELLKSLGVLNLDNKERRIIHG